MSYKESEEWQEIISQNYQFFKESTLRWWGCEVLWDTLTADSNGNKYFLTLEDNFESTQKRYSIRKVDAKGIISTLSWQQTDDLAVARHLLIKAANYSVAQ
jgi:hypothetical protein